MTRQLRVAIVHYHMKRGGVTRVVESLLRGFEACNASIECRVLTGAAVGPDFPGRHTVVEGLAYSNAQATTPTAEVLADRMIEAAREGLGAVPDVWHIHNHALGKNSSLPGAINILADRGHALLLQMHDFSEDGRSANYRLIRASATPPAALYPDSPRVHYATINGRDQSFFAATGIPRERLHLLPNPVTGPVRDPQGQADPSLLTQLGAERLILYPVRFLRRKNVGEMLFWAGRAEPGTVFATTLGPTNVDSQALYADWKSFARELDLPVRWTLAESTDAPFPSLVASADQIVTTSVAEGFGLAFLEPWLFGKPICGRDLPAITADFKRAGIGLENLYPQLLIPRAWVDRIELKRALHLALTECYAAYQLPLPEDATERALDAISDASGNIDFGGLDEALQRRVLQRVARDPAAADAVMPNRLQDRSSSATIEANRERVIRTYSMDRYCKAVEDLYLRITDCPSAPVRHLDSRRLLEAYLKPEHFLLLRS